MLIYWILFIGFAAGALIERPTRFDPILWIGGLLMALIIGLRFHVGADWIPYAEMFTYSGRISFAHAASLSDPAYFVLNWGVHRIGGQFWMVNTICGLIFVFGLIRFARTQERPWLTIVVAVPYLVVVVAMGYTRQSVAIGVILAGLASYLNDRSVMKLAIYFFVASLFHKTALVAFPLICVGTSRNMLIGVATVTAVTYLMYNKFLSTHVDLLIRNYIDVAYSSQGAGIRIGITVVAATLFFANRTNLGFNDTERAVWRNFSVASFVLLAMLWIVPSSTAVDRLALFVIPLQLAVLPRAWKGRMTAAVGVITVTVYSAAVLFAWLNFAVHAKYWLPYQIYPLTT